MMEEFNVPHQKVREKSVYLLHLDAARIILISAAVIGIVVVSFLLGMNFVRGGEGTPSMFSKGDIFDSQKELDLLKTNIPGSPDENDISRPIDENLAAPDKDTRGIIGDALLPAPDAAGKNTKNMNEDKSVIANNDSADMLTNENIKDPVAPPAEKNRTKRYQDDTKSATRSADVETLDRPAKKSAVKNKTRKRKSSRSSVVAVSEDRVEQKGRNHGGYTIQVGSFDKKSSALSEMRSLKEMHYDAHVDETTVKGKQYFRVRIGPVGTKRKALDLLKDIQDINQYQESYMTRE